MVVGSTNQPKREAVAEAFGRVYPDEAIEVTGVATDSGVSSHPTSAEESLRGAENRIQGAMEQNPGADYYVGIEGGLLRAGERAWEIGWVAIRNTEGRIATAPSAGVEQRGKILQAILGGQELNDVLEERLGIAKIGNANGFYGLATDDVVTRQRAYTDAVIFALAQFKHPEFFED